MTIDGDTTAEPATSESDDWRDVRVEHPEYTLSGHSTFTPSKKHLRYFTVRLPESRIASDPSSAFRFRFNGEYENRRELIARINKILADTEE